MIIPRERSERFLIVDDEGFNLIALDGILGLNGFKYIEQAFDGNHAMEVMRDNDYNFDFVFTDYQMPHMNGV